MKNNNSKTKEKKQMLTNKTTFLIHVDKKKIYCGYLLYILRRFNDEK